MVVRFAVTSAMARAGNDSGIFRYPFHKANMSRDKKKPNVRLAYNPGPTNAYKTLAPPPSVRFSLANAQAERNNTSSLDIERETLPALLVSYVYLKDFLKARNKYHFRDWVLDSGAFSAHNSGVQINLADYIAVCKDLLQNDPLLTEVFALDVIGDWKASLKNCEQMWKAGVPAIPCYHVGEPEHVLKTIAKDYPKIALGGAVGYKDKDRWAKQCFARVYPKKIHGFGYGSEKSILALPWHSVDATSWELGPCAFGRWAHFGKMSVRGSKQNLRVEVDFYLKLEQKARSFWQKEMQRLEALDAPDIRLALATGATERTQKTFSTKKKVLR